MFQKWLIGFLADRGWRYLQARRTGKKLQRSLNHNAKHAATRRAVKRSAKRAEAKRSKQGFKPGRALALLALGAGAWAYYRSRQQTAAGDAWPSTDFSSLPSDFSTTKLNSVPSVETSTVSASPTLAVATPEASAPTYNAQAASDAPATPGDTSVVIESEAPTYDVQAQLDEAIMPENTVAEQHASQQIDIMPGEAEPAETDVASDVEPTLGDTKANDQKM